LPDYAESLRAYATEPVRTQRGGVAQLCSATREWTKHLRVVIAPASVGCCYPNHAANV